MVQRVRMPSISFIVARTHKTQVIGCENKLPWHLKSDLQRFRRLTTGYPIIMGRKTFVSIGKPLPNRTNIVLSRDSGLSNAAPITFDEKNQVYNVTNKEAALYLADLHSIVSEQDCFFIIGGEEIFKLFSTKNLVDRVYLTEVFAEIEGDAFFKQRFPDKSWKTIQEEFFPANEGDDYDSRFIVYERRNRRYRDRYLSSFYTESFTKIEWIKAYVKAHQSRIKEYEVTHQLELDFSNRL